MATKKPSTITQLKQVLERAKTLEAENAKLVKELASEKSSKDTWYKRSEDYGSEIEQIHALLDVLPGAASRTTEGENSWDRKQISAMTRLAAYLANRGSAAA